MKIRATSFEKVGLTKTNLKFYDEYNVVKTFETIDFNKIVRS